MLAHAKVTPHKQEAVSLFTLGVLLAPSDDWEALTH